MSEHNKLGPVEIIPPLVAVAGTIIWISIDGFTGESIAQSLTALCTMFVILIPIYKHILKKPKDTHLESGLKACIDLRKKYAEVITGPTFRKDDYKPGIPHSDHQYLFIQKPESRRKATFVAVSPLKKAIIEINFSRTSQEILKIAGDFNTTQQHLHNAVLEYAGAQYAGLFIEKNVEEIENICVVLDFDIEKVSVAEFHVITRELVECAIETLLHMQHK